MAETKGTYSEGTGSGPVAGGRQEAKEGTEEAVISGGPGDPQEGAQAAQPEKSGANSGDAVNGDVVREVSKRTKDRLSQICRDLFSEGFLVIGGVISFDVDEKSGMIQANDSEPGLFDNFGGGADSNDARAKAWIKMAQIVSMDNMSSKLSRNSN